MDKNCLEKFLIEFEYPQESIESLSLAFDKIRDCGLEGAFDEIVNRYAENIQADHYKMIADTEALAVSAEVHTYQAWFLMLIALTEPLKGYYAERGIAPSIWKNTLLDLKYKCLKCKTIHGVWGTFVPDWFFGFFKLKCFGFGKLEFEPKAFGETFQLGEVSLEPKSRVINVHIPRTGTPLDRESMISAYSQAKEFFKDIRYGDKTVFVCHSWLLFQKHKQILKKGSNLYQFIDDYTVVTEGEYPDYKETWRLFHTVALEDIEALPKDTSLQRAYVEMMKKGEKTGWAYGAFLL